MQQAVADFSNANMTYEARISALQEHYTNVITALATTKANFKAVLQTMVKDLSLVDVQARCLQVLKTYLMVQNGKAMTYFEQIAKQADAYDSRVQQALADFENASKVVRIRL